MHDRGARFRVTPRLHERRQPPLPMASPFPVSQEFALLPARGQEIPQVLPPEERIRLRSIPPQALAQQLLLLRETVRRVERKGPVRDPAADSAVPEGSEDAGQ